MSVVNVFGTVLSAELVAIEGVTVEAKVSGVVTESAITASDGTYAITDLNTNQPGLLVASKGTLPVSPTGLAFGPSTSSPFSGADFVIELRPIVERIAQAISTKTQTLSVANGDSFDATVSRPPQKGIPTPTDGLVVIVQGDPEQSEEHEYAGNPNSIAWVQPFSVFVFVRRAESDTTAVEAYVNSRQADVIKALHADRQWSGLAIDSRVRAIRGIETSDGSHAGVEIEFAVTYRTSAVDPYVLA